MSELTSVWSLYMNTTVPSWIITTLKWFDDSQDRVILNSSSKFEPGTLSTRVERSSYSLSSSLGGYWTLDVLIYSSFSFILMEISFYAAFCLFCMDLLMERTVNSLTVIRIALTIVYFNFFVSCANSLYPAAKWSYSKNFKLWVQQGPWVRLLKRLYNIFSNTLSYIKFGSWFLFFWGSTKNSSIKSKHVSLVIKASIC